MTRRVHIIGIGLGSAQHLTGEAIRAMNEVDVFLVADKGSQKQELVDVRRQLCDEVIGHDRWEFRAIADPKRGPDAERDAAQYAEGVAAWHRARVAVFAEEIRGMPAEATVGFLVWGDPAFYDSTIRMVEQLKEHLDLTVRVVAGLSAIQVLAAEHGIALNAVGGPVHITTGRRLVDSWAPELGTVVVMLDGQLACRTLVAKAPDLQIYWGACLGLPQQRLVSGRLAEVLPEIERVRADVRGELGWVMDVYALTPTVVPTA